MHGTTMIFLMVMPVLTGFGIYLVPLMIGADDLAFPRLAAVSFCLQLCGGALLYLSFAIGAAPDAGWFSYSPLTEKGFSPGAGLDYWSVALLLLAASAVVSARSRGHDRHNAHIRHDHAAASFVRLDDADHLADDRILAACVGRVVGDAVE
jgi:hypothetical protein